MEQNTNKFLPIGTIVLLKDATKRLMITGFCVVPNEDKNKIFEVYEDLMEYNNEEPTKIVVMLSNQFRLIYQARNLYKKGYSEKDIASLLNIHPYRIKLAITKGNNFQDSVLLAYLEKLSDLDIKIKTGTIDKELGLELFILNI